MRLTAPGIVTGRLTKAPAVYNNNDGSRKIRFTVAAQDHFTDGDGNRGSQFIPPEAFIPAKQTGNGLVLLVDSIALLESRTSKEARFAFKRMNALTFLFMEFTEHVIESPVIIAFIDFSVGWNRRRRRGSFIHGRRDIRSIRIRIPFSIIMLLQTLYIALGYPGVIFPLPLGGKSGIYLVASPAHLTDGVALTESPQPFLEAVPVPPPHDSHYLVTEWLLCNHQLAVFQIIPVTVAHP